MNLQDIIKKLPKSSDLIKQIQLEIKKYHIDLIKYENQIIINENKIK